MLYESIFRRLNQSWRPGLRAFLHRYERALMVLVASAGLTAILLHLEFNLLEANLSSLNHLASESFHHNKA